MIDMQRRIDEGEKGGKNEIRNIDGEFEGNIAHIQQEKLERNVQAGSGIGVLLKENEKCQPEQVYNREEKYDLSREANAWVMDGESLINS